tara:strand:+ start:59215 stop:59667 length:453 start_codon:yes stop_codon:yes gene_type:complete
MKKLFLSAFVALFTFAASAQFMVVTTYDGDQEENMDKITANMGIGYMMGDFTVGLMKGNHDHVEGEDHDDDAYDLWARYSLASVMSGMDGAYAALQMPMEDGSDNMQIGVGFALNVWNGLYVEPNYMMPVSEDDNGDREGSFNFGLSYRF